MARTCLSLILAAGEGTRMRSSLPKVLHTIGNIPMLSHVMRVCDKAGSNAVAVVVGNGSQAVSEVVETENSEATIHIQAERLGTAHAVLAARDAIEQGVDDILILFGDTPLLTMDTLSSMRAVLADGAAVVVVGFHADDPTGYGRLIEDGDKLVAIREHAEASEAERTIRFCNGGIMGLSGDHALALLDAIDNDNAKGEYYLTDVVEVANSQGLEVKALEASETELIGVNTRNGLAQVEALWQHAARQRFMALGVTMHAPETVFLSADTLIEADVTIEPNVVFGPNVLVKSGTYIKAFSHLEGAVIGCNADIGPFARLRPGTDLADNTKVGNFVEVKNALLHEGAKINHLTYIGDAEIGSKANIGAGTITCNYDGANKHKTTVGSGAFVGSNSALVAPVTIGNGAYVASGSVITEDVPDNALGIARGRQSNKDGMGKIIRERNTALKVKRSK